MVGSGIVVLVPSTTKLSIRLVPVDVVLPLKMIRKAAFGLSFKPGMADKLNTNGVEPNAVGGVKRLPKLIQLSPSRLY